MRLRLRLPGQVTCRHCSRYSPDHERTFARHCATAVDGVARNTAAMRRVVPPDHEPALVREASWVSTSGTHTDGLAHVWNGTQSRTEQG